MAVAAATASLSPRVPSSVVAPIDIQLPKVAVSAAVGAVAAAAGTGESLGGDSGYESSWPSLSEAAAWSSAQPGVRKSHLPRSTTHHLHAHHHHHHHHPRHLFGSSPTGSSPDMSGSSSGGGPSVSMLHHHHRHQQQQQASLHPQQQIPQGKKCKHRRRRTQALNFHTLEHQTLLEPLVDFGSPLMDDVDEVPHHQELPIPLSAIPRRWLYEEDDVSGDDDVLVTVPKREWVYCSSSALSMDAKSFVVMSWNLLSPRLCHALRLHHRCDQAHLDWKTRKEAVLNQILFMDADIICLQEIEKQDFDEFFEPQLTRLGYRSIHAYKTNLYEIRDGCAMFYRDSRFKLNDHHILRYNQMELDDEKRPSMARDTAIRFNLFHNLAIVALLENKRTHRLVQVATTHLLADPAYPDAKMLQSAILVSKLEELKAKALAEYGHCGHPATHAARQHSHIHHCFHPAYYRPMASYPDSKHSRTSTSSSSTSSGPAGQNFKPCPALDIPTIIAGDFNSLPHSSVINFLKTGRVETSHFGGYDFGRFTRKAHKYLHHSLELTDCYKDSTLPYTNITRNFEGTIDYMLFAKKSLCLVGFLDHLEKPPAAVDDEQNKSGKAAKNARSKKSKKEIAEDSKARDGRIEPNVPLHLLLQEDNDDDENVEACFPIENSDSEEPTMSSDSQGEMSGLGDDDSSGSDVDQEGMDLSIRSSFTPTTIWSSLTPLQQQRLTLASRTFSNASNVAITCKPTVPSTTTPAAAASIKANTTHLNPNAHATGAAARYPLPTMPSQYLPSDHIPLAAVFRERDMTVCCCSQSCRRRTDDPKL